MGKDVGLLSIYGSLIGEGVGHHSIYGSLMGEGVGHHSIYGSLMGEGVGHHSIYAVLTFGKVKVRRFPPWSQKLSLFGVLGVLSNEKI